MNVSNIPLLDVAISLVFLYFLLSLFVSGLMEFINSLVIKEIGQFGNRRALLLKKTIDEVFDDRSNKNWSELIYAHPLIESIKEYSKRKDRTYLPSYIPANIFASALIEIITQEAQITTFSNDRTSFKISLPSTKPLENFVEGLKTLNESNTKILLMSFLKEAETLKEVEKNVASWYEASMDRLSGWFKRDTQGKVLVISLFVTLFFNIDTIRVTKELWYNSTLRESIVNQAVKTVENYQAKTQVKFNYQNTDTTKKDTINKNIPTAKDTLNAKLQYLDSLRNDIISLNLPIGWAICKLKKDSLENNDSCNCNNQKPCIAKNEGEWIKKQFYMIICQFEYMNLLGWTLTVLALSFGSPFWFDLLLKLVNIRNAGKKPEREN